MPDDECKDNVLDLTRLLKQKPPENTDSIEVLNSLLSYVHNMKAKPSLISVSLAVALARNMSRSGYSMQHTKELIERIYQQEKLL